MRFLVLDPRNSDLYSELFVYNTGKGYDGKITLGYVPCVHYDPVTKEIIVVDTYADENNWSATSFWLKIFSAQTFSLKHKKQISVRPMYAGFPGRSNDIASTASGRYIYFLHSSPLINRPGLEDTFYVGVNRYNRELDKIESGNFGVESCTLDFGNLESEDGLFFHLSCDFPSTVVTGKFFSPELQQFQLENLPPRMHSPQETCGSWFNKTTNTLFCISGDGQIYSFNNSLGRTEKLIRLHVNTPRSIPLHHLYGSSGKLFIGVSVGDETRSFGLVSEIWEVDQKNPGKPRIIELPMEVINFIVTDDGQTLFGVNPYQRSVIILDVKTGKILDKFEDVGLTPAEVILID